MNLVFHLSEYGSEKKTTANALTSDETSPRRGFARWPDFCFIFHVVKETIIIFLRSIHVHWQRYFEKLQRVYD